MRYSSYLVGTSSNQDVVCNKIDVVDVIAHITRNCSEYRNSPARNENNDRRQEDLEAGRQQEVRQLKKHSKYCIQFGCDQD
jgi:hypothetical protein